jgi:hypothetical protein
LFNLLHVEHTNESAKPIAVHCCTAANRLLLDDLVAAAAAGS